METFDFEFMYYPVDTFIFCSFWFVVTYFVIIIIGYNNNRLFCYNNNRLQSIGAECEVGPRLILVVSSPGVGNSSSQYLVDGCWQELHIHSLSSEVHAIFVTL